MKKSKCVKKFVGTFRAYLTLGNANLSGGMTIEEEMYIKIEYKNYQRASIC